MEKPKRLNKEEAQKEAAMIRAHLGVSPETGKISEQAETNELIEEINFREATPEDYEIAQKTLDELEKLAEKDPELLVKLMQYAGISIVGIALPLVAIATSKIFPNISDEITPDGWRTEWERAKENIFSDARSKLKRLRDKGDKFQKAEISSDGK